MQRRVHPAVAQFEQKSNEVSTLAAANPRICVAGTRNPHNSRIADGSLIASTPVPSARFRICFITGHLVTNSLIIKASASDTTILPRFDARITPEDPVGL
jgi:hypothetical protein